MSNPSLQKTIALVTGGTRGIGLAIARALLDRGACVAVSGVRDESVRDATAALSAYAERATVIQADVRRADEVERMVEETVAEFGGLDVLVNNAGVGRFVELADMSIEQWHEMIDTNLNGAFYCSRAAIPHLRRRKGGWIINISSLAGKNWFAGGSAYCASKAGLNAMSEALMQEVRYDGIRVSTVMPGSVTTEFGGHEPGTADSWKLAVEDIAQVVVDLIGHDRRSLPSRVEIRPSQPRRK
jgi:NAD(P)-dependent dehydrogenase (short-subunit alcohol dehydrogenase family)